MTLLNNALRLPSETRCTHAKLVVSNEKQQKTKDITSLLQLSVRARMNETLRETKISRSK